MSIQSGDIIQCPECRTDCYRFKHEVLAGQIIQAASIEPMPGVPAPKDHSHMCCPECGADLGRTFKVTEIHLKGVGWV